MVLYLLDVFIALSQPIDVYSDWIDACDEVAKVTAANAPPPAAPAAARPAATSAGARAGLAPDTERYDDEGDGFIDDDDAEAEAEYADE